MLDERAPAVKTYKDILSRENPDDGAYSAIVKKIAPYTMTLQEGLESTYALFQAVKYLTQNKIPGDMVECGVWRGGSMMLIAYALKHFGDVSRELHLYDTYDGMTRPDEIDIDFDGKSMRAVWAQAKKEGKVIGFGGTADYVKTNLLTTGYPERRMHFIAGDVLETIPAQAPSHIALLRLDTDWYKSTLYELQHLYDLVAPNGVVIFDDYGWCRGARQAIDEFFGVRSFKPMLHRLNQGARLVIKPP